ncbi:hypothetical protein Tco_1037854, partial [Tanacetum coccineum]
QTPYDLHYEDDVVSVTAEPQHDSGDGLDSGDCVCPHNHLSSENSSINSEEEAVLLNFNYWLSVLYRDFFHQVQSSFMSLHGIQGDCGSSATGDFQAWGRGDQRYLFLVREQLRGLVVELQLHAYQ